MTGQEKAQKCLRESQGVSDNLKLSKAWMPLG
jgi:hypothetical protein